MLLQFPRYCQSSLWTLIVFSRMFVTLDDTRENGTKSFVIVKTSVFWNVSSYRPVRSQRNGLVSCTITVKKPCGLLYLFSGICHARKYEKSGQKFFFHWKGCLLSKPCAFNNLLGSKKSFFNFQKSCQKTFWSLKVCSLRFAIPDNTRKNEPKTFVIVKTANIWNVCLYRLLRSQRNVPIICTKIVKVHCGPLYFVSWHLSCSIKQEKKGPKGFFLVEKLPFFKNFCFQQPLRS